MTVADLPATNASLNSLAATLLTAGYIFIRRGQSQRHRACMLGAVAVSALFLTSYTIYHLQVGSVPYPLYDWTRTLYFVLLVPHILLAAGMAPFVVIALYLALTGRFDRHARVTRWLWPVWMFVSVSGVVIYWMLYHVAGAQISPPGAEG